MHEIFWSENARSDIDNIHQYIAKDSIYHADAFILTIIESINALEQHPRLGRKVPEYQEENIREIICRNYRIIYHLSNKIITIVTVINGAIRQVKL